MIRRQTRHTATGRRSHGPSPTRAASGVARRTPLASALAVLPYIGAIGALLYGVLRLAFVFFYLQLRATPEEVGFGYAEVLASQTVGAGWLVVLLALPLFALGLLLDAARTHRTAAAPGGQPATPPGSRMGQIARWSVVTSTVLVLVGLPVVAWTAGGDAAQGYTVRNVYLLGTIPLPVLAVQAVPARVSWTSDPPEATRTLEDRQCLLYLGQADGVSVFYDVASQQSLRLPAHAITVTLENTTGVPQGC